MNTETALTVEVVKIKQVALGLVQKAEALEVVDQESADFAGALAKELKVELGRWEGYWGPKKASAKATHTMMCDAEGEISKRVKPAILRLSEKASAWFYAEREKFRKAKEERERAEWEAKRKVEQAEEKVEQASGFEEAAAAIAEIPHEDLGPAPVAPKVEDAEFRDHWVWERVDFDKIPRRFLMEDKAAIDEEIAAKDKSNIGDGLSLIAGLRVFNKPIMASKRRST